MHDRGWSGTTVARLLGVNKGTISRSLGSNSFSPPLRVRVALLLDPVSQAPVDELLQESLHKLRLSDMMRSDAEMLIASALDLIRQTH